MASLRSYALCSVLFSIPPKEPTSSAKTLSPRDSNKKQRLTIPCPPNLLYATKQRQKKTDFITQKLSILYPSSTMRKVCQSSIISGLAKMHTRKQLKAVILNESTNVNYMRAFLLWGLGGYIWNIWSSRQNILETRCEKA